MCRGFGPANRTVDWAKADDNKAASTSEDPNCPAKSERKPRQPEGAGKNKTDAAGRHHWTEACFSFKKIFRKNIIYSTFFYLSYHYLSTIFFRLHCFFREFFSITHPKNMGESGGKGDCVVPGGLL